MSNNILTIRFSNLKSKSNIDPYICLRKKTWYPALHRLKCKSFYIIGKWKFSTGFLKLRNLVFEKVIWSKQAIHQGHAKFWFKSLQAPFIKSHSWFLVLSWTFFMVTQGYKGDPKCSFGPNNHVIGWLYNFFIGP